MSRRMPAEENGGHDGLWRLIILRSYMINGSRPSQNINLGLPLRPHRRPARRHHLRHCRHGLVDHADAGTDLSIRAEGSRSDHGGRGRDGEPVAHSRLVARGRLAGLPRLFGHGDSGRCTWRADPARAALARRRYRDRPVSDRDGAGAALAGRAIRSRRSSGIWRSAAPSSAISPASWCRPVRSACRCFCFTD